METVSVLIITDANKACDVPVGDVFRAFQVFAELVAVLDYHQLVPADQLLLTELDLGADAGIIAVGPLV